MDPTIRAKFDTEYMEFQRWTSSTFGTAKVQTEEEGNFLSTVTALCYGADQNYKALCQAYDQQDQTRVAWACRNLMEIAIYAKFALESKKNAEEFARPFDRRARHYSSSSEDSCRVEPTAPRSRPRRLLKEHRAADGF